MYDVVALGELLIDFTCLETDADGYPTMAAHPGGAPANFLAALSRFGAKTAAARVACLHSSIRKNREYANVEMRKAEMRNAISAFRIGWLHIWHIYILKNLCQLFVLAMPKPNKRSVASGCRSTAVEARFRLCPSHGR